METGLKHPRLFPVLDRLSTYSYIKPGHTRSSSMEHSSPLAAMQPSSLPFGPWGCRNDVPLSYPNYGGQYGGKLGFGPSSFDFKDLSMTKAPADYFNLKSVRGSSPTTTLAADLSQNFHIDQSPQLPTPRRSLFSQNLFGTINGREQATTPPLPSSSPGPGNDSMDISPLPHKAPFVAAQIVASPTRETTHINGLNSSLPNVSPVPSTEASRQPAPSERRRLTLQRPSLSRTKVHSTTAVPLKNARAENLLPPFKFANGPSLPSASLMSPDECFASSPPQQKDQTTADMSLPTVMGPPRLKQPFSGLSGHLRSTGSPIIGHVRKPSMPTQRPRKQFRRSLSMFEHPGDFLKQEKANIGSNGAMDSIMDVDDVPQLQLPHFISEEESLPRITKDTMVDILDGKYGKYYRRSIVVDCRFEYEYTGGHIEGAINVNSKEELASQLLETTSAEKTLLVFHCEYSAHRAPIMAKFLRQKDRAANVHRYPLLTYPEVYILDGGYSSFFMDHSFRCFPQNYVEMAAKEHANACERGLGKIKQQRTKLGRAQTFAFGEHNQPMDDSPTAPNRQCSSSLMMGMEISVDRHLDLRRLPSRRMASY